MTLWEVYTVEYIPGILHSHFLGMSIHNSEAARQDLEVDGRVRQTKQFYIKLYFLRVADGTKIFFCDQLFFFSADCNANKYNSHFSN